MRPVGFVGPGVNVDISMITATEVRGLAVDAARHTLASGGGGIVWIDLGYEDREGMRLLNDLLHARPNDVDDCFTGGASATPSPSV